LKQNPALTIAEYRARQERNQRSTNAPENALERAYISEGLSQSLAKKYSATTAVKEMTQNCSIYKVKLIMQAKHE